MSATGTACPNRIPGEEVCITGCEKTLTHQAWRVQLSVDEFWGVVAKTLLHRWFMRFANWVLDA